MNKKTLFSALGVVLLGAAGSGLWELIKPLFGWTWSGLLTLSTLGLDSLRNGIYADSVGAISPIPLIFQGLGGLVMLTGAAVISYIRLSLRPTPNKIATTYYLILFIGSITLAVGFTRTAYVAQLASYTAKLEIIAAPHISEVESKKLKARSVQIHDRASYLAYISTLQKIIESTGNEAPTREFF